MTELISRVPVQSIVVVRDGKQVTPDLDKPFNFTAQEVEDIERVNPSAMRKPIVEKSAEVEKTEAKAPAAGKRAGKADEGL